MGQSDLKKCSEAWNKFINIQQDAEESAKSYVSKFEQAESLLKNVNIIIPSKALAIHLLGKSNLNPQSKENVLTKTELDGDAIYSSLKKSFREMKSDLTTTAMRKDSDKVSNNKFYSERRGRKQSFSHSYQYKPWRNSYENNSNRRHARNSNRSHSRGRDRRHADRSLSRRGRGDRHTSRNRQNGGYSAGNCQPIVKFVIIRHQN